MYRKEKERNFEFTLIALARPCLVFVSVRDLSYASNRINITHLFIIDFGIELLVRARICFKCQALRIMKVYFFQPKE